MPTAAVEAVGDPTSELRRLGLCDEAGVQQNDGLAARLSDDYDELVVGDVRYALDPHGAVLPLPVG
ncbi:hypothetical protein ACFQ0M_16950 [Kitasatospora aburaviensis]